MPKALVPVLLSLRVATAATIITLVVGLYLARSLTRHRTRFSTIWDTLIMLPMVFPPSMTGYLLLLLLGRRGPLGSLLSLFGLQVVFTWGAAVIAASVVSLPLMYQNCKAALAGVDPMYLKAARTLGMDEGAIFRRVTLPLAAPGILSGLVLSFARALGEFGATLMVAGNLPGRTQTMPLALFSAVEGGRTSEARLYLLVTIFLSFVVIFIVGHAQRQSRAYREDCQS